MKAYELAFKLILHPSDLVTIVGKNGVSYSIESVNRNNKYDGFCPTLVELQEGGACVVSNQ